MLHPLRTGLAAAAAAMCVGSASAQAPPAGHAEYQLAAGDSIRVFVYQSPDLTIEARVSERGTITYPLVGTVAVGTLSISQAEQRIATALRTKRMIKRPHVNIVLLQVRGNQVSVLGHVNKPGRFPLETVNVRVSDMLAAAGGVMPSGADVVTLSGMRQGKPFRKLIDVPGLFQDRRSDDDLRVVAGDTLYVDKAPLYYVYGEAQRPGPYRVERGMTVMHALAQAGGPTPRGSQERLRLTRTQPDGAVVQTVPRLTDPVQPSDVLYVRESIF